jgi:hypothetical protein
MTYTVPIQHTSLALTVVQPSMQLFPPLALDDFVAMIKTAIRETQYTLQHTSLA